jgi:chromosome segregation ATPase
MIDDEPLDFDDRIGQVLASKPTYFADTKVSMELVAWAIKAIEEAGLHPSLKLVSRVVGKQVPQRDLIPLVNQSYRQRLEALKRRGRAISVDHLSELYEVVSNQVRPQVEEELSEEFAAVKEAREQVEHARRVIEGERESAAHKLEIAESIRDEIQNELTLARMERAENQERAELMASALGDSKREVLVLNQQIAGIIRKNHELSTKLDARASSLAKLRDQLGRSRSKEVSASSELRSVASKLSSAHKECEALKLRLETQRSSSASVAQELAELKTSNQRAVNELKRAQASLARDREAISSQKKDHRELRAQLAEVNRRESRLAKDLAAMSKARDRALTTAKLSQESADQARQMVERLMRETFVTKRSAARTDAPG